MYVRSKFEDKRWIEIFATENSSVCSQSRNIENDGKTFLREKNLESTFKIEGKWKI